MAYIAKTNGGNTILELRDASLDDLPPSEKPNWRNVVPQMDQITDLYQVRTDTYFEVAPDLSVVYMKNHIADVDPILVKTKLREYATQIRWERQQGGVTLPDGTKIKTDDASQAKIHQAFSILKEGWTPYINFKTSSGWVQVDLTMMTTITQYVAAHIQNCFTQEKAILAAIDAGTVTTRVQILNWAW